MTRPDDVVPVMVGFARTLRAAGVDAGADRVRAWVDALTWLDAGGTANVYWSGRLTLCASPDELRTYDAAFVAYFGDPPTPPRPTGSPRSRQTLAVAPPGDSGRPTVPRDGYERPTAAAASRHEVLRHRDLATLSAAERREVNRLFAALRPSGPHRRSRRQRPARYGRMDSARTVRSMLRRGGEAVDIRYRARTRVPRRVVLLIDVSGSMAPYADGLIRFAHVACRRRPSTEVFTIGTRLTRVTQPLRNPDPDRAISSAGTTVPDWSGGTRLGEQLKAFLDRWGQRGMARGAVVVVCSDGWERGDVELLAAQTARLQRLAYRVVWVSPHAGKEGFAPEVAGLQAALPFVDRLVAGHSIDSLDRLARLLSQEVIDA